MPTKPASYTLADGNWTQIADFTDQADQPRLVRITNSGSAGQIMYAPAHLAPGDTPDVADVGIDVDTDGSVEIGAVRPGNGNVLEIWAKGNGMAGKVSVVL